MGALSLAGLLLWSQALQPRLIYPGSDFKCLEPQPDGSLVFLADWDESGDATLVETRHGATTTIAEHVHQHRFRPHGDRARNTRFLDVERQPDRDDTCDHRVSKDGRSILYQASTKAEAPYSLWWFDRRTGARTLLQRGVAARHGFEYAAGEESVLAIKADHPEATDPGFSTGKLLLLRPRSWWGSTTLLRGVGPTELNVSPGGHSFYVFGCRGAPGSTGICPVGLGRTDGTRARWLDADGHPGGRVLFDGKEDQALIEASRQEPGGLLRASVTSGAFSWVSRAAANSYPSSSAISRDGKEVAFLEGTGSTDGALHLVDLGANTDRVVGRSVVGLVHFDRDAEWLYSLDNESPRTVGVTATSVATDKTAEAAANVTGILQSGESDLLFLSDLDADTGWKLKLLRNGEARELGANVVEESYGTSPNGDSVYWTSTQVMGAVPPHPTGASDRFCYPGRSLFVARSPDWKAELLGTGILGRENFISPDGSTLLTFDAALESGKVVPRLLRSGSDLRLARQADAPFVRGVAFSTDGRFVAIPAFENPYAKSGPLAIVRVSDGEKVANIAGVSQFVWTGSSELYAVGAEGLYWLDAAAEQQSAPQ